MLNVVFASDDNYVPFLGVAITSLIKNNQNDFDKINIFILDDGITEENKNKIKKTITNPNHILNFIKTKNLADLEVNILSLERNIDMESLTTYSRLFIPSLLPNNIDKVIYMDCDALIVDSFKELWNVNIDDYYCGAVLDGTNAIVRNKLGFTLEDTYINAGFLLINLKKWRTGNIEEKFIQFMIENQNKYYQHDQGVLNNVFKNQFLILDPKYNLQNYFQIIDYDLAKKYLVIKGEYYPKEIINQAKENPTFIHFCGWIYDRPWYNNYHPYRNLYKKYSDVAGFTDEIFEDIDVLPLKFKLFYKSIDNPLLKLGLKIIPTFLVHKILNKNALIEFEKEEEKIRQMKK